MKGKVTEVKPRTLEIFMECNNCVCSKKPIMHEKPKLQTVMVISVWFSVASVSMVQCCTMGNVEIKSICSQFL